MRPDIWIGAATVVGSLLIGRVAVADLRRQRSPILVGLGLSPGRGWAGEFTAGVVIAGFVMLGLFAVERGLGAIKMQGATASPIQAILYASALLPLAFFEELLNRSLMLSGLTYLLKGRVHLAVALSAVVFGLAHAGNPAASILSVAGNGLGGLAYGLAFIWTRRIWLPFGLHFAWNLVQGPVLGFPVSGHPMGGVQHIVDAGPPWLTGGAYGPEAGLIGLASRLVILAGVVGWVRMRRRTSNA